MTPVDQTREGVGGNCLAACLASIFNCGLADTPELSDAPTWAEQRRRIDEWLAPRGLRTSVTLGPPQRDEGLVIVSGTVARSDCMHATVWRGDELVHDPHPSRAGLVKIEDTLAFVPELSRSCV